MLVFAVLTTTLADPLQLFQRYRGQEYFRRYYRRLDVQAAIWAAVGTSCYYLFSILIYFLLQAPPLIH